MPPKAQKSKEAKLLAAQSSSKAKGKKKWSKGKSREKKIHKVVFNAALLDKFLKDVKKMKVVTVYNLIELFKINGSLARRGIKELLTRNLIKPVDIQGQCSVYTGTGVKAAAAEEKAEGGKQQKGKKGKPTKKEAKAAAAAEEEAADE